MRLFARAWLAITSTRAPANPRVANSFSAASRLRALVATADLFRGAALARGRRALLEVECVGMNVADPWWRAVGWQPILALQAALAKRQHQARRGASRFAASTMITKTAQAASEIAFSCAPGGNTSTNPLPLMSCEKLDTQNGIMKSRKTVQRSGGGLPGSRTERYSAIPMMRLMPSAFSQMAGAGSK